jgi:hypothetical protein
MTSQNLRVVKAGDDDEKADANRVEQLLVFLVRQCFNAYLFQNCCSFLKWSNLFMQELEVCNTAISETFSKCPFIHLLFALE